MHLVQRFHNVQVRNLCDDKRRLRSTFALDVQGQNSEADFDTVIVGKHCRAGTADFRILDQCTFVTVPSEQNFVIGIVAVHGIERKLNIGGRGKALVVADDCAGRKRRKHNIVLCKNQLIRPAGKRQLVRCFRFGNTIAGARL